MAEFFQRGAKIGDQSNRYEQTCKRCGEHFSRGRTEALVPHLTKRCPSITKIERAKIVFRLHDLAVPDLHPYIDPTFNPETGQAGGANLQQDSNQPTANTTFFENREQHFDGLNVLAEASRRVGRNARGITGYTHSDHAGSEAAEPQDDVPLDPQLEADSFTHHFLQEDSTAAQDNGMLPSTASFAFQPVLTETNAGFPTTTAGYLPPIYSYMENLPLPPQSGLHYISTGPSDLSTIAATANATLASDDTADTDMHMPNEVSSGSLENFEDHGFPPQARPHLPWPTMGPTSPHDEHNVPSQPIHASDQPFTASQAMQAQQLRPLAINPSLRPGQLSEDAGALPQAPKPRVRGRFEPERRKEVRELRKLGACMRCRMLKKTCSPETPCQTCVAVESPRLWKLTCVRTKLDEEFPLYFTMPFQVLAHQSLEPLKKRATFQPFAGRLEAYHFPDEKILFKGRQIKISAPPITADDPDQVFAAGEVIIVADLETENVVPKADRYLQATYTKVIDQELSHTMQPTLQIAQIIQERQQRSVSDEKRDGLIPEIIELWVATSMITDTRLRASFTTDTGLEDGRVSVDEAKDGAVYRVLTLQLRAAIEKRAGIVCRSVLHHFEQRVLSRNKSNNFETFLVAFILLNCAERMYWLYRRWTAPNSDYPLDGEATRYAKMAESFAQTIQMLLSIRQLEPKIMVDSTTGFIIARNKDDAALTEWLQAVGFTTDIAAHFGTGQFDPNDSRSLDGVFSAPLVQL